jgi:hypothetical protein
VEDEPDVADLLTRALREAAWPGVKWPGPGDGQRGRMALNSWVIECRAPFGRDQAAMNVVAAAAER